MGAANVVCLARGRRSCHHRRPGGTLTSQSQLVSEGFWGNPAGRLRGSRNRLSEAITCALLRDFDKYGEKAIARVREENPAMYLKVIAMVLPRQHKVEHRNPLKEMTDEQLERGIELIKQMIAERDAAANAKVIEGEAKVVPSLPAPTAANAKTL